MCSGFIEDGVIRHGDESISHHDAIYIIQIKKRPCLYNIPERRGLATVATAIASTTTCARGRTGMAGAVGWAHPGPAPGLPMTAPRRGHFRIEIHDQFPRALYARGAVPLNPSTMGERENCGANTPLAGAIDYMHIMQPQPYDCPFY